MPGSLVRHLKLHGAPRALGESSTVALRKVKDRIFFYRRIFIAKIFLNRFYT